MAQDYIAETVLAIDDIRQKLSGYTDKTNVLKSHTDRINISNGTCVITERSMAGESLIWGSPAFGIWGTSLWSEGPYDSFVLGSPVSGILGVSILGFSDTGETITRIISSNNNFREYFRHTDFIESNTATITTSTGTCSFTTGQEVISKMIYKNTAITRVTLVSTQTSGSTLSYYVSIDGSTWESVTPNIEYVLNTSGSELYYKITSAGNNTITKISITYV